MHATLASAQFKSSIGKFPEELFPAFEPESFAAASLGQVHRALTFKGEKVAVKIQYPAIRSAIENDFKLLRSATLPAQLTGHVPTALLDEIQRGILEETDYLREAHNVEFFRQGLSGLPFVTVPRVFRELSSDRVLTMSFVEGGSLSDFLQRKPSRELRNLVGARIAEAFETQIRRLKMLHADQHPGNYLFRPDGTIGLVDFGCVKRVEIDIDELRRFYDERSWRESEPAARRFLAMVYGPGVPYKKARRILPLFDEWLDFYRPKGSTADIIFGQRPPSVEAKLRSIRIKLRQRTLRDKLINPEFAFITRADVGFHHLLRELGAVVNFSEVMRRVAAAGSSQE